MEYRTYCLIDAKGYYVDLVVAKLVDGTAPCAEWYTLKEGEILVDSAKPASRQYAGAVGFIRPKWDGSAWAEDATAEEIAAWEAAHPVKVQTLEEVQAQQITESKTKLAEYLESHPLTWTDGKQYSVTEDKQALLTGNLAAYQLAVTLGQANPELTWNATGEECTVWTFENLAMLAIAIKAYVKPLVAYQQKTEIAIRACSTAEDVEAVTIDYESVGGNA